MSTLAALILLLQAAQTAPQIRADVRVQPDSVRVGQPATLTLSLASVPADAEVVFPELTDSGTVAALGPPRPLARSGIERAAVYEVVAWSTGDLTVALGPVRVVAPDRDVHVAVPTARLHVASALPRDADPDTLAWRPPGPVVGPNWSLAEKAAAVALALALLALTGIYVLRRGRTDPPPAPLPRPAKELALDALDRLAAGELLAAGEYKAFHAELSHVLRTFLARTDRRWGLDLTTGEILSATRGGGLDAARAHALIEVLAAADLVKFARMVSGPERARHLLANARHWVARFERAPGTGDREPQRDAGDAVPVVDATDMDDLFAALDDEAEDLADDADGIVGDGRDGGRERRRDP